MTNAAPVQQKQPTIKVWEAASSGLPRLLVHGYTKEEAKREYRARMNLHESRQVELTELTDAIRSGKP